MKQYIIMPAFNEAAIDKNQDRAAIRAAIQQQTVDGLKQIRKPVSQIVRAQGGKVVNSGKGYGVQGHSQQYCSFMVVNAPEAAVAALKAVPGVGAVSENGTVYALGKQSGPSI